MADEKKGKEAAEEAECGCCGEKGCECSCGDSKSCCSGGGHGGCGGGYRGHGCGGGKFVIGFLLGILLTIGGFALFHAGRCSSGHHGYCPVETSGQTK